MGNQRKWRKCWHFQMVPRRKVLVLSDQCTVLNNFWCLYMSHLYGKSIARVFTGAGGRYPGVRVLFCFFYKASQIPWYPVLTSRGSSRSSIVRSSIVGWSMSPNPKILKITKFCWAFSTGRSAPMGLEIGAIERSRRVQYVPSWVVLRPPQIIELAEFRWFSVDFSALGTGYRPGDVQEPRGHRLWTCPTHFQRANEV